jgi:pimeloyl-ACP methyl ester carboxylesterase
MPEQHYDITGSGPVLLVLPGGSGHPMGLERMIDRLAARFTVVTYDPLGLAHGRLGEPVAEQHPADWSEGARRVLDAVLPAGRAAYVLGMSSGGIAALDLLARHPRRLRHVVAHEPPCVGVLPDGARWRAAFREVARTCRAAGVRAAGERLAAVLDGREPEPDAAEPAGAPLPEAEEVSSPFALFLTRVLVPFTAAPPPVDALAAHAGRLTVAAGSGSRGGLLHRTAAALAERTGAALAEFPGGHLGAAEHPEEFADRFTAEVGTEVSTAAGTEVSRVGSGMPSPHLQES